MAIEITEKSFENWICDHIEPFQECVMRLFNDRISDDASIQFLGNQFRLGKDNIVDMAFAIEDPDALTGDSYLVLVELKAAQLTPSHYNQLCRYVNIAAEVVPGYYSDVFGVLVGFGYSESVSDILMTSQGSNIRTLSASSQYDFTPLRLTYKSEYINSLHLDSRLFPLDGETDVE